MQDSSSAFLSAITSRKTEFVIKEHQPSEDKIDLLKLSKNKQGFKNYLVQTARLLAWSILRSSGYKGSATADDLIKFSENTKLKKACLEYAFNYSKKVFEDFEKYKRSENKSKRKNKSLP